MQQQACLDKVVLDIYCCAFTTADADADAVAAADEQCGAFASCYECEGVVGCTWCYEGTLTFKKPACLSSRNKVSTCHPGCMGIVWGLCLYCLFQTI
jgi:hypothetical protein